MTVLLGHVMDLTEPKRSGPSMLKICHLFEANGATTEMPCFLYSNQAGSLLSTDESGPPIEAKR